MDTLSSHAENGKFQSLGPGSVNYRENVFITARAWRIPCRPFQGCWSECEPAVFFSNRMSSVASVSEFQVYQVYQVYLYGLPTSSGRKCQDIV